MQHHDRPRHAAIEAALQQVIDSVGIERLVATAWTAGRHAEVTYDEWLDNTTGAPYRRERDREYAKRAAERRAQRQLSHTEGTAR